MLDARYSEYDATMRAGGWIQNRVSRIQHRPQLGLERLLGDIEADATGGEVIENIEEALLVAPDELGW